MFNESPLKDEALLAVSKLREEGTKDEEKCQELIRLTRLLNNDSSADEKPDHKNNSLHKLIENNCLDTILGLLDKRNSQQVQSHSALTVSTYLKSAGHSGSENISKIIRSKLKKKKSNDCIIAFSILANLFPFVPDLISTIIMNEGLISSLENLVKRYLKCKETEWVALEMLNAACINTNCRGAISMYCTGWLVESVQGQLKSDSNEALSDTDRSENNDLPSQKSHLNIIGDLAAVIMAKLQAVSKNTPRIEESGKSVLVDVDELSNRFKEMLFSYPSQQMSIEGLAYTSLQPKVKEELAYDKKFLQNLIKTLGDPLIKPTVMFGALSILVNLTSYMPVLSEEQKNINQLRSYANASKSTEPDLLNDDEHVMRRCQSVFEAGVIPTLVTHTQNISTSSLNLVVSIISSIAKTPRFRGQMVQQGVVKMLLYSFSKFPADSLTDRRKTAHALARILISINPLHIFSGSSPISIISAITPLVLIISDDTTVEHQDLLPVFESLLALTNLASTDNNARNPIIRLAFPQIDELLFYKNKMVVRATIELICNLVLSEEGVKKFVQDDIQAKNRLNILLAMTDAEDLATRRAAGGALAGLTQWDIAISSILELERGVRLLLRLCTEDQDDLRHRGVVCIFNMISMPGNIGKKSIAKIRSEKGIDTLRECIKNSRDEEVINIAVETLKRLSTVGEIHTGHTHGS